MKKLIEVWGKKSTKPVITKLKTNEKKKKKVLKSQASCAPH